MNILIVGCGYLGTAVAQDLIQRGDDVTGICRGSEPSKALREAGIQPWIADITSLDSLRAAKPAFDAAVHCVSSARGGEAAYREVYLKGTVNLIEWLRPRPPKVLVYTGSTTVYAQTDGSWVDETSPADPPHASGRILRETEKLLLDSGLPAVILRLAGIYGPGRHAMLDKLRTDATTLPGDGQPYVNMVHRDDIVSAIRASIDRTPCGELINVADDEPTRQIDYVRWLCEQLRRPMITFDPAAKPAFKGTLRRDFQPNRRVRNQKMKTSLGIQLRYPNFREGLRPLIEKAPG